MISLATISINVIIPIKEEKYIKKNQQSHIKDAELKLPIYTSKIEWNQCDVADIKWWLLNRNVCLVRHRKIWREIFVVGIFREFICVFFWQWLGAEYCKISV